MAEPRKGLRDLRAELADARRIIASAGGVECKESTREGENARTAVHSESANQRAFEERVPAFERELDDIAGRPPGPDRPVRIRDLAQRIRELAEQVHRSHDRLVKLEPVARRC